MPSSDPEEPRELVGTARRRPLGLLTSPLFKEESMAARTFRGFKVKVKSLSRVQLFAIPWTVAYQAPPSMEFSRQESWSGLLFPSPEDLPQPEIEPGSLALQADAFTT